jgi:hypothetical protein
MKKTLCFAAFSAGAVLAGTGAASAQDVPPSSDQPASRSHTVVAGESLSKISQAELGTSDRWVEIYALNRDVVADPDAIEVGQVLDIPAVPVTVAPDVLAGLAPAAAPPPVSPRQSAQATAVRPRATRTDAVASRRGGGGALSAIRACESGGDYGAVSAGGRYRGAYQFDRQTWQSVGGSGDPAAASPAEQDARARQLWNQRGSNPWPNCG